MKYNFFRKILITYNIIIFTIISIIFIGYYIKIQSNTQQRINKSNSINFLAYVDDCEELFNNINYTAEAVKATKSIDMFMYSSSNDYYIKMTQLFNDLSVLSQNMHERQFTIVVHKINDNTAVSNVSTTTVDAVLNELNIDPDTYRNIVSKLPENSLDMGHYIFTDNYVIYVTSKRYIDNKMIIMLILDAQKFKMSNFSENMAVSFTLSGSDSTDLRTNILKPAIAFDTANAKMQEGLYNKKYGSVTYKWINSRFLNLDYFYYTDNSIADKNMVITILDMFFALLGTCALAFVLILYGSIRLYKPIRKLIDAFKFLNINENQFQISNNEIDYIAEQVHNTKNLNQELTKKIDDNNKYIEDKLIYEILTGSYCKETVDVELAKLNLGWFYEKCFVVIFEFSNHNNELIIKEPSFLNNVKNFIYEQLIENFKCRSLLYGDIPLCFVVNCNSILILKEKLNNLVYSINTSFNMLSSVYIGSMSESITELRKSFITACRLLDNKNLISIRNIYDYRDLDELPESLVVYPINTELQLINAVDKNNREEAMRIIEYIFDEYVNKFFENKEDRELIVITLANTINRVLQKTGFKISYIFGNGKIPYLELGKCNNSSSLKQYIINVFDKILDEVQNANEVKLNQLKKNLAEYINKNLSTNISLLSISEHFNLSPNYMSYIFKTAMGDNFKDYLTKKQFEAAATILKEDPSIKLIDLANNVGIGSVNTLIRIFKKYSGVTPGQFIKEII
ncbi:MAG TPA: hypothetical protein DD426_01470 [Clostridiaceae bacterium]|nr:hypothetical protein [Clostridiaceae bacterium]